MTNTAVIQFLNFIPTNGTVLMNIIHSAQPSNLISPFVPRDRPEKNDIGRSQNDIGRSAWKP